MKNIYTLFLLLFIASCGATRGTESVSPNKKHPPRNSGGTKNPTKPTEENEFMKNRPGDKKPEEILDKVSGINWIDVESPCFKLKFPRNRGYSQSVRLVKDVEDDMTIYLVSESWTTLVNGKPKGFDLSISVPKTQVYDNKSCETLSNKFDKFVNESRHRSDVKKTFSGKKGIKYFSRREKDSLTTVDQFIAFYMNHQQKCMIAIFGRTSNTEYNFKPFSLKGNTLYDKVFKNTFENINFK